MRSLLDRRFGSVSEVETLVLLVRSGRQWTAAEVAREFVVAEDYAAMLLDTLVQNGLIRASDGGYEFAPLRARDRRAAVDLADIYQTYRVRIMNLLLAKPRDAFSDFAEAFRLRPHDEDPED